MDSDNICLKHWTIKKKGYHTDGDNTAWIFCNEHFSDDVKDEFSAASASGSAIKFQKLKL